MAKEIEQLMSALNRLDTGLEVQRGRMGLMERWLRDHAARLEELSDRLDTSLARVDALLKRR
jgi:hypothetical protein